MRAIFTILLLVAAIVGASGCATDWSRFLGDVTLADLMEQQEALREEYIRWNDVGIEAATARDEARMTQARRRGEVIREEWSEVERALARYGIAVGPIDEAAPDE